MDWLNSLVSGENGWGWLVLAAILFALDVMAPGFYLVWFGLAASVVGGLLFLAYRLYMENRETIFANVGTVGGVALALTRRNGSDS